mmetsp:Transcript_22779/g.10967  ORF Transcript_22779/g.10967 Transcript_22779/m.10967 type:complete len:284 (+) Transcript_22779:2673-3524(+)
MTLLLIDADLYVAKTVAIGLKEQTQETNLLLDKEITDILEASMFLFDGMLRKLFDLLDMNSFLLFFSCSREDNWRRVHVCTSYKKNRDRKKQSSSSSSLFDFMRHKFSAMVKSKYKKESVFWSFLEADDLIGIYATAIGRKDKESLVVCSWDKDFLTVPCFLYNPYQEKKMMIQSISKELAFENLMLQVMTGDASDNYKGIKGVGKKKAGSFLKPFIEKLDTENLHRVWGFIVKFAKEYSNQDEVYMEQQLQLAYILRHHDFNFRTNTITYMNSKRLQRLLKE